MQNRHMAILYLIIIYICLFVNTKNRKMSIYNTIMNINERIFKLLDKNKKSQKEYAEYIGTTPQTVNKWKTRGTEPPSEYIWKTAEFFNVSIEYILTGRMSKLNAELTSDEKLLIRRYRNISKEQQVLIMGMAEQFCPDDTGYRI